MGAKPENLITIDYRPRLILNDEVVPYVEVDLTHINFGKEEKKRRSNFTWQQMARIIEDVLDTDDCEPVGEDATHFYFQIEFNLKDSPYKRIFL